MGTRAAEAEVYLAKARKQRNKNKGEELIQGVINMQEVPNELKIFIGKVTKDDELTKKLLNPER